MVLKFGEFYIAFKYILYSAVCVRRLLNFTFCLSEILKYFNFLIKFLVKQGFAQIVPVWDFQVMVFCRGAQELRQISIWFDEITKFSLSFFPFLHGWSIGCSSVSWNPTPLKILTHCEEAAEEPGCSSSCKATEAAPSASPVEMRAINKLGKIIFILIIWSWSFSAPTCYLRDFHRPSWSCHIWHLSLEQGEAPALACAQRQTHLSLVIPWQQEWQLPDWCYLLEMGNLQRGLVGSMKQSTCLCSFNFHVHQTSSATPELTSRSLR